MSAAMIQSAVAVVKPGERCDAAQRARQANNPAVVERTKVPASKPQRLGTKRGLSMLKGNTGDSMVWSKA